MTTILLVDDEIQFVSLLVESIERIDPKYKCVTCHDVETAKEILVNEKIDIIVTDMNLQGPLNGSDLIKHVVDNHSEIPIAVLSAYDDETTAIEALKVGAFDFLNKPIVQKHLKFLMVRMCAAVNKNKENIQQLKAKENSTAARLIGESGLISNLKSKLVKISKGQAPIFIQGESGVGKEVVAHVIHNLSSRSEGPFVAINCGAIPPDLIESELFGYKKGSFTGAAQDSLGLIRAAKGGTLFLDEVGELPPDVQVKLLRVIQEKSVRPIGGGKEEFVDFRVISATHRDLKELVKAGSFRQDLYFRLFVMDVHVPPLRDRGSDILLLAEYFCTQICEKWGIANKEITVEVKNWLLNHSFSGNVRELQNIMERAIALSENNQIGMSDVTENPDDFKNITTDYLKVEPTKNFVLDENGAILVNKTFLADCDVLDDYLMDVEKIIILKVLDDTIGNKTLAAKKLGISFRSLRYRLKKLGLEAEADDEVYEVATN